MKILKFILLAVSIFTWISCNNDLAQKTETELKQEIELAMDKYVEAVKIANVDSVLDCWAENSRYISSKNDISGKDELKEFLSPLYEKLEVFELTTHTLRLEVSEELAAQFIEYSEEVSFGDSQKKSLSGRMLTIWKKEGEEWKISMVNTIPINDSIH